jgi:predicted nucleic acid-binding protein
MPSVVVDASALVDLLIGSPAAGALFERLFRHGTELHAPHSIDVEVAHAIRKLWLRGLLVDWQIEEIAAIYPRLKIERHDNRSILHRIWSLRHNHTPYDAAYVARAEWLDLPLVTRDRALANSPAHAARIEFID